MKLFYSPGACSIAAHIALEMAEANYVPIRVAIANDENMKPEYLAINPQGRVPTLAIDDRVITELSAILLYVDRAFPSARLMPKSALDFARAASMMAFLSSNVHIAIATIWRPERFTDDTQAKTALETHGLHNLKAHFAHIEAQLPDNGWLFNFPQASLADLNLLPFYRFGLRLGLRMAEFPKYTALVQRAEMLPTVRRVLDRENVESFLSSKPAAL